MPEPTSNTGRSQIGGEVRSAASQLSGPALMLAQGATATATASATLGNVVLDKLLGPTALVAGGLVGALRTMKSIGEQSGML